MKQQRTLLTKWQRRLVAEHLVQMSAMRLTATQLRDTRKTLVAQLRKLNRST